LFFPLPWPPLAWPFPAALPGVLLPEPAVFPAVPLPAAAALSPGLPVPDGVLGVAVARASRSEQYAVTLSFPPAAATSCCQALASSALPRSSTCS